MELLPPVGVSIGPDLAAFSPCPFPPAPGLDLEKGRGMGGSKVDICGRPRLLDGQQGPVGSSKVSEPGSLGMWPPTLGHRAFPPGTWSTLPALPQPARAQRWQRWKSLRAMPWTSALGAQDRGLHEGPWPRPAF